MAKKLTESDVKEIIKSIHNSKYSFEFFTYKNKRTKFILNCKNHGEFQSTLDQIKRGQGCPICGKSDAAKKRRITFKDFINKSQKTHNNKYIYDENSYTKLSEKTRIKCPIHGWFEQLADCHLNQKQGCPECGRLSQIKKRKLSNEEFIKKAELIHNKKYTYPKLKYTNSKSKINVICPTHGIFNTNAGNHLMGSECPKCAIENTHKLQLKSIENFIHDSNLMHEGKFDYSLVEYKGGKIKVKIICPKHGVFEQSPNHHQRGAGCPNCNVSKGEELIKKILKKHHIKFNTQFTFDGLKDKRKLKCDFYLPFENCVIEFNGRQHYESVNAFGGLEALKETQKRDQIKYNYLKDNNINLIIVRYDCEDVESYLLEKLKIR